MINLTGLWFNTNRYLESQNKQSSIFIFVMILLISLSKLISSSIANNISSSLFLTTLKLKYPADVVLLILTTFLLTAIINFFIKTSLSDNNKNNNEKFFFSTMLLSYTPILLLTPLSLALKFFNIVNYLNYFSKFIYIWIFLLQIKIIKKFLHISGIKAFMTYILTILLILVINILFFYNSFFAFIFTLKGV